MIQPFSCRTKQNLGFLIPAPKVRGTLTKGKHHYPRTWIPVLALLQKRVSSPLRDSVFSSKKELLHSGGRHCCLVIAAYWALTMCQEHFTMYTLAPAPGGAQVPESVRHEFRSQLYHLLAVPLSKLTSLWLSLPICHGSNNNFLIHKVFARPKEDNACE